MSRAISGNKEINQWIFEKTTEQLKEIKRRIESRIEINEVFESSPISRVKLSDHSPKSDDFWLERRNGTDDCGMTYLP